MSKVSRRTDVTVIGGKQIARHRKPIGAGIILVFLVIDSLYLHLLHDLLGAASGWVAFILFLGALARIAWALRRRIAR
jgi:hypothetical protein